MEKDWLRNGGMNDCFFLCFIDKKEIAIVEIAIVSFFVSYHSLLNGKRLVKKWRHERLFLSLFY